MSTQSPSIILGQRLSPVGDELAGGDLQQLAGKLVFILRHRCWLFILPTLAGMLSVLVASLLIPPEYTLRTVFERRNDPVMTKLVSSTPFDFKPLRGSMRFSLVGYRAVERAAEQIGLTRDLPRNSSGELTAEGRAQRQVLVSGLVADLAVYTLESNETLDLVEVRYTGHQPELGQRLVTQLKDNYLQEAQALINGVQNQAWQFFADEAGKRREKVACLRAELAQVLAQQPEVDPGRPDYLDQAMAAEELAIEQAQRLRREAVSEIRVREEYLADLEKDERTGGVPGRPALVETHALPNPAKARLEGEITTVLAQIADAKTVKGMKEAHPYVESLRSKLGQLHIELDKVPEEIASTPIGPREAPPNPYEVQRKRVDMEMKTLQARLEQIDADIGKHKTAQAAIQEKKSTLFERRQAFMLRQQEMENVRSDLNVWNNNLEEINRLLTAEAGNCGIKLSTVEDARCPEKPIKPKLSGTFMLSSGLGLALGVALLFLRELFDRSFRNPARVRQVLGIPVLEAIGEIRVPGHQRWLSRRILAGIAVFQVVAILTMGILVYLSLERPKTYEQLTGLLWSSIQSMGILGG